MPERPGEFDLINDFFSPLAAGHAGSLGLTDDAALLAVPDGKELVVTADTLVAGVHFLETDPPAAVAQKVLAVNLSDLAAMGASPHAYTLAAAWPRDLPGDWIAGFAGGLKTAQESAEIQLVGGDTVATPGPLTLNVTALGHVDAGNALRRSGANPGDRVFVSGTIGDAALGLGLLTDEIQADNEADRAFLVQRYHAPEPRNGLGQRLVEFASAAIDVSDGLIADAGHLAKQSGVDIAIDADRVPLSAATRHLLDGAPALSGHIFAGGDDYELVFTVPETALQLVAEAAAASGTEVTEIGSVTGKTGSRGAVRLLDAKGNLMKSDKGGYRHF